MSAVKGFYKENDDIILIADFGLNVIVRGMPELSLRVGADETIRARFSGTTENASRYQQFTYTVAPGDEDSDGIEITGIILNETASIQDTLNYDIEPFGDAIHLPSVVVDNSSPTTTPSLSISPMPPSDDTHPQLMIGNLVVGAKELIRIYENANCTGPPMATRVVRATSETVDISFPLHSSGNYSFSVKIVSLLGYESSCTSASYTLLPPPEITAGQYHTCFLSSTGAIKCWGYGDLGQLGQGNRQNIGDEAGEMGNNLSAIDLGTVDGTANGPALAAITIDTSFYHVCALLTNGRVKCWGNGADGQLGQGHTNGIGDEVAEMGNNLNAINLGTVDGRDSGAPLTAKTISVGHYHSCALLNNGRIKCWGSGYGGVLGQGNTNTVGDEVAEMGNNLNAINLGTVDGTDSGTPLTAKTISAGNRHTCAILSNDAIKCWGDGSNGQLGQGHSNTIGDEVDEMGNNLNAIDLGTVDETALTAKDVQAGNYHTCALLSNNTVKCWGDGANGELGQGHANTIGDDVDEMGNNLDAIDLGTVDGMVGGTALIAKAIRVGHHHSCALLSNDTIKCWGSGVDGQLGQGHTNAIGDEVAEMGHNLSAIDLGTVGGINSGAILTARDIGLGRNHTCALLSNGGIKCWGGGYHGQLGQENTNSHGGDENHMGNNLATIDLD